VRKGDEARARAQHIVERRGVEPPALAIDAPLADDDAVRGEPPPDTRVRLVVLIRDDDLVAGRKLLPKCLREHVGVL
jgi:hypothetical protein